MRGRLPPLQAQVLFMPDLSVNAGHQSSRPRGPAFAPGLECMMCRHVSAFAFAAPARQAKQATPIVSNRRLSPQSLAQTPLLGVEFRGAGCLQQEEDAEGQAHRAPGVTTARHPLYA